MPLTVQYDQLEDGELVERTQADDPAAYDALYYRYYTEICAHIISMIGNDETARDLAQDTFVKAWRNISQLQGEKHFRAWVYRIASNVVLDHERHRHRIQWLPWIEPDQGGPEILVDGFEGTIEDQQVLLGALAKIPSHYRQCVLLQIVNGYSQRKIAELLGISEGSVSTYVRRGLDALRQTCLLEYGRSVPKKGK